MAWTKEQLDSIQVAERVTSVFSLAGCSFIIVTFCSSARFRKPINRLLFYASFGNILSVVAMLIARQGVIAGQHSALCQLQAFFIQQWMPADALWSFCMALNVYLTTYKRYTVAQLRLLEWKYFLVCYGIPLLPNVIMICIHTKERGRIYGPATIWCSITKEWQFLRIACFYGPVWFISLGTLIIFLKVGRDVFNADCNFRRFSSPVSADVHASGPSLAIRKATTVEVQREIEILPLESPSRQDSLPSLAHAITASTSRSTTYCKATGTISFTSPSSPSIATTSPHTSLLTRSYLRCSLLFFLAMVVTWLPSSINRVYSLIHPTSSNYPLNIFAATVLPLQGLWNSLIYLTTSYPICSDLFIMHVLAPIRQRRRGITISGGIPIPAPFVGRSGARERLGSVESRSALFGGKNARGRAEHGYDFRRP